MWGELRQGELDGGGWKEKRKHAVRLLRLRTHLVTLGAITSRNDFLFGPTALSWNHVYPDNN